MWLKPRSVFAGTRAAAALLGRVHDVQHALDAAEAAPRRVERDERPASTDSPTTAMLRRRSGRETP